MYRQLSIDSDGSELLTYNTPDFPVRSVGGNLYYFHNFAAGCHWHNDFEFLIADEGSLDYFVNGQVVNITQGQGIFVNARRLHYGFSSRHEDCTYSVLVFHPDIFGSTAMPMGRYARAVSADTAPDYLLLTDPEVLDLIRSVQLSFREQTAWYELDVLSACCGILQQIRKQMDAQASMPEPDAGWIAMRQMIGYLQANYPNPIRLEDIAAAGAVCRSKCCTLFQEKLNATPIAYLNRYRMEKARELLLTTRLPVTQIAHQCGFDSPSYFSEQFRRTYGESPRSVRSRAT